MKEVEFTWVLNQPIVWEEMYLLLWSISLMETLMSLLMEKVKEL